MLPAQQGDALWIEYGDLGSVHRILIDGGTSPTHKVLKERIEALQDHRTFELFIVTHIDTDHIGGALKLLADSSLEAPFEDVWFNDLDDLPDCPAARGPIDGAMMTRVLEGLGIGRNQMFGGERVAVPDEGILRQVSLEGGM